MSDIIIKPTDWNIDVTKYSIKPGDRIVLQGPLRAHIRFVNVRGTAEKPITITADSKVVIKAATAGEKVVLFQGCDFIHMDGTEKRLIEITGGAHGIEYTDLSNHPEFSFLDIHDTGATGIGIKTYPTCDKRTWRGAFTLQDPVIRNCQFWNIGTEAIYLGCSHYHESFPLKCADGTTSALEHEVTNALVSGNIIRNCGMDGIQVGGATGGVLIDSNEVYNTGTSKIWGQASGIQANPGSLATIQNNIVDGCTNFGIIVQGRAGTIVRNNRISNTVGGIMTVIRDGATGKIEVYNNDFIDITGNLIQYYSDTEVKDNVLNAKTGSAMYVKKGTGVLIKANNFELFGNSEQLKLDSNFVPAADSPVPLTVGYRPKPKSVTTYYHALIEKVVTGDKTEFTLTTEEDTTIRFKLMQ